MIISKNDLRLYEMPKVLMVGKNTLAAKILGRKWAEKPHSKSPSDLISAENCSFMIEGYRAAMAGTPTYQYLSLDTNFHDGEREQVPYTRLIIPFRTELGANFFGTLAFRAAPAEEFDWNAPAKARTQDQGISHAIS